MKSFILHYDSLDVLDELTDEQAGQIFKAIKKYNNGEPTGLSGLLKGVFISFRNQLNRDKLRYEDKCEKNRENALKRWNKKDNTNDATACDRIQLDANDAYSKNKNKSNSKKDSNNNTKKKFGEYKNILLTEEEVNKLKDKFPSDWLPKIEELSIAIETYGYKYKSHYLVILKWARDKKEVIPQERKKNYIY